MQRRAVAWVVGLSVCFAATADASTFKKKKRQYKNFVAANASVEASNQYLIELAGSGPADLAAAVEAAGGSLSWHNARFGYASAVSDSGSFAKKLAKASGVKSVDRDMLVQWTPADDSFARVAGNAGAAGHGGDPTTAFFYPCQWNLPQIDAPGAWGKDVFGHPGVKVAVLDSGVDPNHQDLAGRVDVANSVSMLSTTSICDLFAPDMPSFEDFRYHGSWVSSIITSNGLGVAGVAPLATVVGVKVLNCLGSGSFSDVIAGILYAAGLPDVDVINMSLGAYFPKNLPGGGPLVAAMNKAVNAANAAGKLVVSAAGNSAADLQHDGNMTSVPAESGTGIAIYATNVNDGLASYSNHGANATLVGAPGGDGVDPDPPLPGCVVSPSLQGGVLGACPTNSLFFGCGSGSSYLIGSGTSFAAPMVSGVAALIDGEAGGSKSPAQLETILKNTADDLGKKGTDNIFSHGRVNASSAVD